MATLIIAALFLVYSAFCWWVVFGSGAEVMEGWKGALFGALFFEWTPVAASELRFGAVVSWVMALVMGLICVFG